jgi:hypothetical protein
MKFRRHFLLFFNYKCYFEPETKSTTSSAFLSKNPGQKDTDNEKLLRLLSHFHFDCV